MGKSGHYFFKHESGDCRIVLGESIPGALQNYLGKPIQLGARPEDVIFCDPFENQEMTHFRQQVTAYENMGKEQLVYFALSGQTLIARRPPRETTGLGRNWISVLCRIRSFAWTIPVERLFVLGINF